MIISDRNVLFTSAFWTHLNHLVGVKMKMSSAYHPETDGSTEHANRTVGQMLRSCIGPTQCDWVLKLPAIEFVINSAHSESTGYAPFFLNTGWMPRSMIWNGPKAEEYPSVRVYAQKMKNVLMAAHDALLTAQMKQTEQANKRRRLCPFIKGDLVYVSMKNIRLERGTSRKLFPKYIGPYLITKDFGNSSYRVNLPDSLKQHGVHNVFHASLLRIHVPNDDRLFPGCRDEQIPELGGINHEWMINHVLTHRGSNTDIKFKVEWSTGDQTWVPPLDIEGSAALGEYLKFLGIEGVSDLQAPQEDLLDQPSSKETTERPGEPVASANTFIQCPCSACCFLSSLSSSTRRKSIHRSPQSSSVNLDSQLSITSSISLFTMDARPSPYTVSNICPASLLWFIVHMSYPDIIRQYGFHWEQVRSIFEYEDSICRHNRGTFKPFGYQEFCRAYELDHPGSRMRLANPGIPALNDITTSPDAREYLGTRRPITEEESTSVGRLGDGPLTNEQQTILNNLLWDSGA